MQVDSQIMRAFLQQKHITDLPFFPEPITITEVSAQNLKGYKGQILVPELKNFESLVFNSKVSSLGFLPFRSVTETVFIIFSMRHLLISGRVLS
jgi:hypothetical protein